jgi:hypothetical protein
MQSEVSLRVCAQRNCPPPENPLHDRQQDDFRRTSRGSMIFQTPFASSCASRFPVLKSFLNIKTIHANINNLTFEDVALSASSHEEGVHSEREDYRNRCFVCRRRNRGPHGSHKGQRNGSEGCPGGQGKYTPKRFCGNRLRPLSRLHSGISWPGYGTCRSGGSPFAGRLDANQRICTHLDGEVF